MASTDDANSSSSASLNTSEVDETGIKSWSVSVVKALRSWKVVSYDSDQHELAVCYWATMLLEAIPNVDLNGPAINRLKSSSVGIDQTDCPNDAAFFCAIIERASKLQLPPTSPLKWLAITGSISARTAFCSGTYGDAKRPPETGTRTVSTLTANVAKCMSVLKAMGFNKNQQSMAEPMLKAKLLELKDAGKGHVGASPARFVNLTMILSRLIDNEIGEAQKAIQTTPNPKKRAAGDDTTNMSVTDHVRLLPLILLILHKALTWFFSSPWNCIQAENLDGSLRSSSKGACQTNVSTTDQRRP